jgi:hypothetical protein
MATKISITEYPQSCQQLDSPEPAFSDIYRSKAMNLSSTYHHQNFSIRVYLEPRTTLYEASVCDRTGQLIFSIVDCDTPERALNTARHEINQVIETALATARGDFGGVA